jgi:hypothetical protein
LIGEGLEQSDLLIAERFHLLSPNCDSPNGVSFAQERYCKDGTRTGGIDEGLGIRELHANFCF